MWELMYNLCGAQLQNQHADTFTQNAVHFLTVLLHTISQLPPEQQVAIAGRPAPECAEQRAALIRNIFGLQQKLNIRHSAATHPIMTVLFEDAREVAGMYLQQRRQQHAQPQPLPPPQQQAQPVPQHHIVMGHPIAEEEAEPEQESEDSTENNDGGA